MEQTEAKTAKSERTILATLVLDTALHIGTGKQNDPTDSPLRRAGNGRFLIPGRAIGGSLRTTATRLAPRLGLKPCRAINKPQKGKIPPCGCVVCQLFGELYPDENDTAEKGGAASKLWISDAFAEGGRPSTSVRDGVGIGRSNGAAARAIKFDYEVIGQQSRFPIRLKYIDEGDDNNDADSQERTQANQRAELLFAALAEWQEGRGQLGGNVARGLGRFHLEDLRCVETRLNSADALIAYLQHDEPWQLAGTDDSWMADRLKAAQGLTKEPPIAAAAGGYITIRYMIALDDPFLVNDPLTAMLSGYDHAPLVEAALIEEKAGKPVLSGASLRGVLRTRAEKIMRTLATKHWGTSGNGRDEFLSHCPACDPLVNREGRPLESCDSRLLISVNDEVPEEALCLGCRLFGNPRRGSRLWVEDAHWAGPPLDENSWKAQDFLAIDRFTGGGQDKAKFDAAPLIGAQFEGRLTLYAPQAWEMGCLALLLRDLADKELTIGFGRAKGYGQAQATGFSWEIGIITAEDFPGPEALLGAMEPSGIYQRTTLAAADQEWLPTGWRDQVQQWVESFGQEVTNFAGHAKLEPLQEDSFFTADGWIEQLYGLSRVKVNP